MAVVGQSKHGQRKEVIGRGKGERTKNREEIHCAHVLLADRTVIACRPGFGEGAPEISKFIRNSLSKARRDETELFLVDTPQNWTLRRVKALFNNAQCLLFFARKGRFDFGILQLCENGVGFHTKSSGINLVPPRASVNNT